MKKFRVTLYFTDGRTFNCEIEANDVYKACRQVEVVKEHLLGLQRYLAEEIKESEDE